MALILEITKADGAVSRVALQDQTTKVAAWPGGTVRIVDSATGKAPAGITAKKVGDSLLVDGLPQGKAVEVTKFYTDCSPAAKCSMVIEPADGSEAVTIDQSSAPVAVVDGGQPLMYAQAASGTQTDASAGAAAAAATGGTSGGVPTEAIIGGIALLGVAAAASGGGGGGGSSTPPPPPADTTPPEAPVISAVASDNIVNAAEAAAGVAVSGTAEAGSTVTVTWGTTSKTATADASGKWSVSFAAGEVPADGNTTISATARDAAGNTSVAGTHPVTVDTTAPGAPTATAGVDGSVTGTAEAGSTVKLGSATVTADASGHYEFAAGTLASGTTGSVTATDAAGNTSPAKSVTASTYELGTAGGDTIVGTAAYIDGGAGNDVIIGGSGGAVRNYQFDYWKVTDASGVLYNDVGAQITFGATAQNGWTIGTTTTTHTADPGASAVVQHSGGEVGSVFAGMNLLAQSAYPAIADDTGGGGQFYWNTVRNPSAPGATLSQNVITDAGAQYTLSMQVGNEAWLPAGDPTDPSPSIGVYWGGQLLGLYDGVTHTWSGTAPSVTTPAAQGGGDSASRQVWTWTVTASGDATALEIRAYSDIPQQADTQVMKVDRITLDPVGAGGDGTIIGGAGNDLIFGQGGNDTIYGGAFGTNPTTTDSGADTFVYSMRAGNGNDVIKDFQVGVDRIYLVDALDTERSASLAPGDGIVAGTTANADTNLTYADFAKADSPTQYLTVTADDNGWLKLGFFGQDNTGAATDLGSVVLEGVNAADYSGVQSLFTGPNAILSATMDGFHTGLQVV